jgi:tetratricopeptide (TPR) repeat protein
MFQKGVRCVDCHDVHTMKTRLPGNFLCLSCHAPGTTNALPIDPVRHSHHQVFGYDTNGIFLNPDLTGYKPGQVRETGGECVNCHMPQTVYMQRHSRHDHGLTIPDPLLTKQFAIPNACNRCHTDKSTEWSLGYVEKWYGDKMNRPYRQRARIIARAVQGDKTARDPLVHMLQTDEIPYWRAVAAGVLQRWAENANVATALIGQLRDTNALVRQKVTQALGPLAQARRTDVLPAVQSMLRDPSRNVRIEAAGFLAAELDTNSVAGREYLQFLDRALDEPLGQLQAGTFQLARGNATAALARFETAVQWDPYSPDIRHELAILLSRLERPRDAVTELEAAVRLAPTNAEFHYKLALALNEAGESARVTPELEQAIKYDPHHAPAWYNLGLARSARGDDEGALQALLRAESADPDDPRIPYARATILLRLRRVAEARTAAQRTLEIDPDFSEAKALLRDLENR